MNKDQQRVTKNPSPSAYDYTLYTDGACKGNPGPGGWGVSIQRSNNEVIGLSGGDKATTNNLMEMQAVIEGLKWLLTARDRTDNILICVDSEYVLKGATEWVNGWRHRGWVKADKKPVKNKDQWKEIVDLLGNFDKVTWSWVRGHSGHPGNERADQLANLGYEAIS